MDNFFEKNLIYLNEIVDSDFKFLLSTSNSYKIAFKLIAYIKIAGKNYEIIRGVQFVSLEIVY